MVELKEGEVKFKHLSFWMKFVILIATFSTILWVGSIILGYVLGAFGL
jgi:hypothetical protein